MQLLPLLFEGDVVTYSSTGSTLYKVTRVKQVKLFAVESGTGRSYELRVEYCRKADNPEDFVEKVAAPADESTVEFYPGMAVRFKNQDARRRGVFVLTQRTQAGWFMSRLGGKDKNRRWHKVQETSIVPVPEINDAEWV